MDACVAEPARSRYAPLWFHLGGAVIVMVAAAGGAHAGLFAAFVTSSCNDADTSGKLLELRLAFIVIGTMVALVAAGWGALAAGLRYAWQPWAVVAAGVGVVTIVAVVSAHVSTWCLF